MYISSSVIQVWLKFQQENLKFDQKYMGPLAASGMNFDNW